jgi:hypothetical protein
MKKDRARTAPMKKQGNEDLLETASQVMEDIRRAYRIYRKKRPIIEFAVDENLIYAFPYAGYYDHLSERSQKLLEREYQEAQANRQIVVFVKDNRTRRLISFSIDENPEDVRCKGQQGRLRGGRSVRPRAKE